MDKSRGASREFAIEEVKTTYTISTAATGGSGKRVKELIVRDVITR